MRYLLGYNFPSEECRKATEGDIKGIRRYLEKGGDVNAYDSEGNTLLHFAVRSGNLEFTKLLLDFGADIHARNYYGDTPLHWSVQSKNLDVVKMLLEHGADPNALNVYTYSPIDWASWRFPDKEIQALLYEWARSKYVSKGENINQVIDLLKKRFPHNEFMNEIIFYLHYYYPKYSSKFDKRSERILKFKNNDHSSFDYYSDILAYYLLPTISNIPDGCAFTVVPSSTAYNFSGGIYRLIPYLIIKSIERYLGSSFVDASRILVRHTSKTKAHLGGERDKSIHMETIRVEQSESIRDRLVILFDDVVTTGNSMVACKELLMRAGAKEVVCFALSKTEHG